MAKLALLDTLAFRIDILFMRSQVNVDPHVATFINAIFDALEINKTLGYGIDASNKFTELTELIQQLSVDSPAVVSDVQGLKVTFSEIDKKIQALCARENCGSIPVRR